MGAPSSTLELSPLLNTMSVKFCILDPIPGVKGSFVHHFVTCYCEHNLSFHKASVCPMILES